MTTDGITACVVDNFTWNRVETLFHSGPRDLSAYQCARQLANAVLYCDRIVCPIPAGGSLIPIPLRDRLAAVDPSLISYRAYQSRQNLELCLDEAAKNFCRFALAEPRLVRNLIEVDGFYSFIDPTLPQGKVDFSAPVGHSFYDIDRLRSAPVVHATSQRLGLLPGHVVYSMELSFRFTGDLARSTEYFLAPPIRSHPQLIYAGVRRFARPVRPPVVDLSRYFVNQVVGCAPASGYEFVARLAAGRHLLRQLSLHGPPGYAEICDPGSREAYLDRWREFAYLMRLPSRLVHAQNAVTQGLVKLADSSTAPLGETIRKSFAAAFTNRLSRIPLPPASLLGRIGLSRRFEVERAITARLLHLERKYEADPTAN